MAEDCGCGCGTEVILIPGVGGVPGPQGPQGPTGPPGAGATFPIPATNISVTNPGYTTVQQALDFLLYNPVVITSFQTGILIYEIGSSVSSLNFIWTLNFNPISQTITGPNLTPPTLIVTDRSKTVTLTAPLNPGAVGTTYSYILSVTDAFNTFTSTVDVMFFNDIYFGDATLPGSIDSAFVNTLSKNLQSNRSSSFLSTSSTGVYAWYAHRDILGTATFSVGGFIGGFEAPVVISVTNTSGFTENYKVYRSTNPSIGPVTITVS